MWGGDVEKERIGRRVGGWGEVVGFKGRREGGGMGGSGLWGNGWEERVGMMESKEGVGYRGREVEGMLIGGNSLDYGLIDGKGMEGGGG